MTHCERPDTATRANDRTGLLIIRAWIEDGSPEPLRAEVRISMDVSAGFERTLTLARTDEVCATVKDWLADIVGHLSP
jgi:hypothetical protein